MKYSRSKFFRFKGDCCQFIEVIEVIHDDGSENAELRAYWNKKLLGSYRRIAEERIRVTKRDYHLWMSYTPTGERVP